MAVSSRSHPKPPEPTRTPIGEAWIENGILWHRIESAQITAAISEETLAVLASIAGSQRLPAIVDIRAAAFAEREAREVFAREVPFEVATALVVDSKVSQALGNFYLKLSQPSRPTKVFTSVADARMWAMGFLGDDLPR